MTDWAEQAGEAKHRQREEAAQQEQSTRERRRREQEAYDRGIDNALKSLVDEAMEAVERFKAKSGDDISVTRRPSGGLSVSKLKFPAGELDFTLDRANHALLWDTYYCPENNQTLGRRQIERIPIVVTASGEIGFGNEAATASQLLQARLRDFFGLI